MYANGELQFNEDIKVESIVGSTMSVKVMESVRFGNYKAIILEVSGEAHITGRHELYFHRDDPFAASFILRK